MGKRDAGCVGDGLDAIMRDVLPPRVQYDRRRAARRISASGPSASSRPCSDARTAPVKPASLRNGPPCFEDARNKVRRSDGMMMGRASSLPDCTSSSTEKYGRMLDAAPRLTRLFIAEIERTS
jgi:hypothetical protein